MEINICQDARACRARRPCGLELCYGSWREAASVLLSALAVLQRVEIVDCVLLWPSLASPAGKLDALYVLLE